MVVNNVAIIQGGKASRSQSLAIAMIGLCKHYGCGARAKKHVGCYRDGKQRGLRRQYTCMHVPCIMLGGRLQTQLARALAVARAAHAARALTKV